MLEKGSLIEGKEMFAIVKEEDGVLNFLCNTERTDMASGGDVEITVDFVHFDIVKWSLQIDDSVYLTSSLDAAAARLVSLSGFEGCSELIRDEKICIVELLPMYRCENLFDGSNIID